MNILQQRWFTIATLLLVPCAGVFGFYYGRTSLHRNTPVHSGQIETQIASTSKAASSPVVTANPQAARSAATWEDRWKELMAKPSTRSRDEQILAAIEDLATRDSTRAIELSLNEPRLRMRQDMLRAALRGWAKVSPEAAADWAISQQTTLDRVDAVTAVLTSAVKTPDTAVKLVKRLSERSPDITNPLGMGLISTFASAGEFTRAAEFAATASPDDQLDWVTTAYSSWADYQPESALATASGLSDTNMQSQAFDAIISVWSGSDPKAVAEFATGLPPGHHRELAFTDALRNWSANDPAAAAEWINRAKPSPELDTGVASVATSYQLVRTPAVAINWAESIMDAQLRSTTLAEVARQWATTDPAAARSYVEATKDIHAEERTVLLAELENK